MKALLASEPSRPGVPNEDFAAVTAGAAVLLDGAGELPHADTGCAHGPAWYAQMLGGFLIAQVCDDHAALREVLATGIEHVNALHAGTCDLRNPRTPGATVIIARQRADRLEYLVLSDSVLLIEPCDSAPQIVSDTRLAEVARPLRKSVHALQPGTAQYAAAQEGYRRELAAARNQPGGFWLAASDPRAATEALTGAVPLAGLSAVGLLSDGAARLADRFGLMTWPQLCALLANGGPDAVIRHVRAAEASDPHCRRWPRSKASDDATAIYWPLPD